MIDRQGNDTFYIPILKLVNDKRIPPSDKYFISEKGFLHKVVREDDKLFHA